MTTLFTRLETMSDWLSPIVVKEVRQMVRTREFLYSFGLSLAAGLTVAALGGTDALRGNAAAGSWIFGWLILCLIVIGLLVSPIGAFSALRSERMERTLDLVMLTTLSARRVVIGKVLAQGVKLLTLFAGMAPFMAMSFLLGGIDLVTILVSLSMLFLWSLWACAAGMFFSSAVKSKAMSGLIVVAIAFIYLFMFVFLMETFGRGAYFFMTRMVGSSGDIWWTLGFSSALCLITLVNLILLAENRLALEDEDHTAGLRVGLFAQFVLVALLPIVYNLLATTLTYSATPYGSIYSWGWTFFTVAAICGTQLVIEAFFMVTGDLTISRRTRLRDKPTRHFAWLTVIFRPGGARAIAYLMTQMALLLGVGFLINPDPMEWRWLLALCGYICLFTGVPPYAYRLIAPHRATPMRLRVTALITFLAAIVLPEIAHYFVASPGISEPYATRHLFNPVVTLADWNNVDELSQWMVIGLGGVGVFAYFRLALMSRRLNAALANEAGRGSL